MHDADFTAADEQLCELLDQYVAAIQTGDDNARTELIAAHPELIAWTTNLEAIDRLSAGKLAATVRLDGETDSRRSQAGTPDLREKFGNFELLEEAGRGGMGVVYKARQTDLDRTVALKMILSSRLASADEVRRFQNEARAAASLRHPNIVGIHEVGQVHGQHFFTMDFIEGQSLARVLLDGPIEPQRAARCVAAIARAVEYLHAHGVVHRDLKPANILLDEQEQPFVTDFGLAKAFHDAADKTATGMILGTPSYMSPEQARGQSAEVTAATDIYSLGAVLYEMLTGRPPFREETQLNTLLQVLEGEPTLPRRLNRRVPPELQRICMCCLEKEPTARYASAAALADDLDRFLRHEPLEVRAVGLRQRAERWFRRNPALAGHAGGLLLTGGIVQVKYLLSGTDLTLHLRIVGLLGAWLVLSCVFERLLRFGSGIAARYAWACTDVVLLTAVLYFSGVPLGPLLIGYPLLVTASGLWFRVRLVWFTTLLALVSYAGLMWLRPEERAGQPVHYPWIFAAVLVVLGLMVAYQIHRVRVLSRYFEQQRMG